MTERYDFMLAALTAAAAGAIVGLMIALSFAWLSAASGGVEFASDDEFASQQEIRRHQGLPGPPPEGTQK